MSQIKIKMKDKCSEVALYQQGQKEMKVGPTAYNSCLWARKALFLAMSLVIFSCSEETELNSFIESESGDVTFYVGNYAEQTRSTTVDYDVIQTKSEAQVDELIAVVFTDVSGGGVSGYTSGQTDSEDDSDTYYGYYTLVGDDGAYDSFTIQSTSAMRLHIDEEGYYQVCFVANPSSTIKSAIEKLATASANTVADFKDLVETQDPSTTPMEMTSSAFYGIYSGQNTDLGYVTLQRIMARIDIVNCVTGVVITKAVFKYRATKSTLIRDNSSDWATDGYNYVATAQKTYTFSYPLIGNSSNTYGSAYGIDVSTASAVNASKCEIYSYEQYAVANSSTGKGYMPVIVLYYYLSDDESEVYTHEVSFEDAGVNIQRNYRYKIMTGYEEGELLTTKIDVDDWNYGTVIEVSESDIIAGLDGYEPSAELAIGDFILNTGSYVCVDDISDGVISISDFSTSYYPVGIVFYVEDADESPSDSRMGTETLAAVSSLDGIGGKHGKALSLTEGQSYQAWAISGNEYSSSSLGLISTTPAKSYADYDGYGNNQIIIATSFEPETYFPAQYYATKVNASPTNTTGWYLPAIGEWYDIIENLSGCSLSTALTSGSKLIVGSSTYTLKTNVESDYTTYWYCFTPSGIATAIAEEINEALYVVSSTYASPISYGYPSASTYIENAMGYWACSEASVNYARCVYFGSDDWFYIPYAQEKTTMSTEILCRGVLAF